MSDRYTSPELSRQLAVAGLAQAEREMVWCACRCASVDGAFRLKHDCHVCREYSVEPGQSAPCLHPAHVRALRLDDVLEELTRDREGGPLIERMRDDWRLTDGPGGCYRFSLSHRYRDRYTSEEGTEMLRADGQEDAPVEAAASVLLALLRERGGK